MSLNEKDSDQRIAAACRAFRICGELVDISLITRGNINTTYRVTFENEGKRKSYLLQKVNTYVFKNPLHIMENINNVTSYIREKYPNSQANVHFHHCNDGSNYYFDTTGEFWRLSNYIPSLSFDLCDDPKVLYGAGYAFGSFQMKLSDFDAGTLHEPIPDFHNTPKRIEKLFADVAADECGRVCEVTEELAFTREHAELATRLMKMLGNGELPLRVTHNDTKSNNVLFDAETLEPLTVIDLDTVMPGLVAFDFGDAIRSAANSAKEDEHDLSTVSLDLEKFTAFAKGFISATDGHLTQNELDTLALGAFTLTFEQAVRFLDDYITGDKYFRTEYPGHNLVRARCQYKLAGDILGKIDKMQEIVQNIAAPKQ